MKIVKSTQINKNDEITAFSLPKNSLLLNSAQSLDKIISWTNRATEIITDTIKEKKKLERKQFNTGDDVEKDNINEGKEEDNMNVKDIAKVGAVATMINTSGVNADMIQAQEGNYDPIKENMLNPIAQEFINNVKVNRVNKLEGENFENATTGRVFLSQQALQMGMIDEIGNIDYALNRANELKIDKSVKIKFNDFL